MYLWRMTSAYSGLQSRFTCMKPLHPSPGITLAHLLSAWSFISTYNSYNRPNAKWRWKVSNSRWYFLRSWTAVCHSRPFSPRGTWAYVLRVVSCAFLWPWNVKGLERTDFSLPMLSASVHVTARTRNGDEWSELDGSRRYFQSWTAVSRHDRRKWNRVNSEWHDRRQWNRVISELTILRSIWASNSVRVKGVSRPMVDGAFVRKVYSSRSSLSNCCSRSVSSLSASCVIRTSFDPYEEKSIGFSLHFLLSPYAVSNPLF